MLLNWVLVNICVGMHIFGNYEYQNTGKSNNIVDSLSSLGSDRAGAWLWGLLHGLSGRIVHL